MKPEQDTDRYLHTNNPNARKTVLEMMAEHNLVDVWREQHEKVRRYTYRQANPRKQGRLDFFLISEDLL